MFFCLNYHYKPPFEEQGGSGGSCGVSSPKGFVFVSFSVHVCESLRFISGVFLGHSPDHWARSSLIWVEWLDSKLLGSTCLCLPVHGAAGACPHIQLFMLFWGLKQVLLLVCKHFTN